MSNRPPEDVLQNYFDELLETGENASPSQYADPLEEQRQRLQRLLYSAAPRPDQAAENIQVQVKPVDASVREIIPVEVPPLPVPESIPELREAPEAEPVVEEPMPAEQFTYRARDLDWLENGRPAWAQTRFDVLLFKVSGLTLAVPLISLGQIQPITDALTPLFGQVDWFMGIQPTPAGKIRTVNTALFVMPERYDENFVNTAKYVISIEGVPWGLAVDSVNQPISLDPDDVKWRSERSKRPWLAGTVKDRMCVLLDIPRIGQILMEAEARRA